MKLIGHSKITRKNQVTLPSEVRIGLNLTQGDYLIFLDKDGDYVLKKGTMELKVVD